MIPPKDMKTIWIHNAIQFGYIAFFSMSFPAAVLIGLFINIFHINFFSFFMTDHIKRIPSQERGNIGVWNSIFTFMSFTALVINIAILMFSSDGAQELINITTGQKLTAYTMILILILSEHFIFLIKFFLTLIIKDRPKWVSEYIKEQKYKLRIDQENDKREMMKEAKVSIKNNLSLKLLRNKMKGLDFEKNDDERKVSVVFRG